MKLRTVLKIGSAVAAAIMAQRKFAGLRPGDQLNQQERRSTPDATALAAGQDADAPVAIDVDRLKALDGPHQPVIDYVSYIQLQRGGNQSLLFVRRRDIEALAALTGESKEKFLDSFQQMGVVLSPN